MYFNSSNPLKSMMRGGLLPQVFVPAALLIILLVLFAIIFPAEADTVFKGINAWILTSLGWFYAITVTGFLILCFVLAFSRTGTITLGPDHALPDYSFTSWFAMLFSAGMGIGLMFFAVAEPISHYVTPPSADPKTIAAAKEAMQATFFHWGIHGWGVYTVVGLTLAYFGYRHRLPLTMRSSLYPLIGDRIYGPIGHAVDIFAVLGTLFGVATSLGLGAAQVNSGLGYLFDVPVNTDVQIILIGLISVAATISVVMGLDAGIKRLSELNLLFAFALLAFIIVLGPTILIFTAFVENLGDYATTIIERSLRLGTYGKDGEWIGNWTIFYWGWWISWSPFVGMFIARISRGRTIREFIVGVLFVPTLLTFFWMTAFGNTALDLVQNGLSGLADTVSTDLPQALFVLLDQFPFSSVVSFIAIILIITFFVTSSDSGSLVIDIITSGGHTKNPLWQRIFWAATQGIVAAALLLAGGLDALRAMAVATALPFAVVLIFALIGLIKALMLEGKKVKGGEMVAQTVPWAKESSWRGRLNWMLTYTSKKEAVERFVNETVVAAMQDVAEEITKHDCAATAFVEPDKAEMRVSHPAEQDFYFAVKTIGYRRPAFAFADTDPDDTSISKGYRAEVFLNEGGQDYCIYSYEKEQVIHEILNQYNRHMQFLHIVRQ